MSRLAFDSLSPTECAVTKARRCSEDGVSCDMGQSSPCLPLDLERHSDITPGDTGSHEQSNWNSASEEH